MLLFIQCVYFYMHHLNWCIWGLALLFSLLCMARCWISKDLAFKMWNTEKTELWFPCPLIPFLTNLLFLVLFVAVVAAVVSFIHLFKGELKNKLLPTLFDQYQNTLVVNQQYGDMSTNNSGDIKKGRVMLLMECTFWSFQITTLLLSVPLGFWVWIGVKISLKMKNWSSFAYFYVKKKAKWFYVFLNK